MCVCVCVCVCACACVCVCVFHFAHTAELTDLKHFIAPSSFLLPSLPSLSSLPPFFPPFLPSLSLSLGSSSTMQALSPQKCASQQNSSTTPSQLWSKQQHLLNLQFYEAVLKQEKASLCMQVIHFLSFTLLAQAHQGLMKRLHVYLLVHRARPLNCLGERAMV